MHSQQDLLTFTSLLSGAKEFHGVTVVGEMKEGKAQGNSTCIYETPTPALFAKHLAGEVGIGISPLKADNTVEFGVVDIDDYKGDLMDIVRAVWDFDMPICPCFSKSRKLHLYFFFAQGTSAEDAVQLMSWYARAFGCNKNVEVFPKQVMRSVRNKAYSWINLPYFNAENDENPRKMVSKEGELLPLASFNDRATHCKWDIHSHNDYITNYPCHDAPPCILSGAILRNVGRGGRNNWLYSAAVYMKLKDESADVETGILDLNASLQDPLDEQEVLNTVIASIKRRTAFYSCANLVDRCDKAVCRKLEHGIGSSKTTGLEFGDLEQIMTDPPHYKWIVNGQQMVFNTEQELMQQSKFRALCLRTLHFLPKPVGEDVWSKIVTKAAKNIRITVPDSNGNDFSAGAQFFDLLCLFFNDQRKALNESQILLGRVWVDESKREFVFLASALIKFITETHGFRAIKEMEMRNRLTDLGAYKAGYTWRLPVESIPKSEKPEVKVDLNLHEGESDDF